MQPSPQYTLELMNLLSQKETPYTLYEKIEKIYVYILVSAPLNCPGILVKNQPHSFLWCLYGLIYTWGIYLGMRYEVGIHLTFFQKALHFSVSFIYNLPPPLIEMAFLIMSYNLLNIWIHFLNICPFIDLFLYLYCPI